VLLTLAADGLSVRPTRGLERLEPRHVELARDLVDGADARRRG
jgi:hypothetical protein